jgi:hypothetical protein
MPNPQTGVPPFVGCPQLLIPYIYSYPWISGVHLICLQLVDVPCHCIVTRDFILSPCVLFIRKNLMIEIYKIIIVPAVLYGCGVWSLTLGEE